MHYEIRPGYAKPVEQFDPRDEQGFAQRWEQCYARRDAGAWTVDDAGRRLGTFEYGRRRESKAGEILNYCQVCSKDFFAVKIERVCFACLMMSRPAEHGPGGEPLPPSRYSREGMRERLSVSGDRDD